MVNNLVGDTILIKWRELIPLQPDNAKIVFNYADIEKSILKHGIAMPFFIWQNEGNNYCIDGHTRKEVYSNIENFPDEVKAVPILVKTREQAIEILIEVYNQKQNPFDVNVLEEMISENDLIINIQSINVKDGQKELIEDKTDNDYLGRYPLAIILTKKDYQTWQDYKRSYSHKNDTQAFLKLINDNLIKI